MTQAIQARAYWEDTVDSYIDNVEPLTAQFCLDTAELAQIEPGMHLLDVATGPGALALEAEARGAEVVAIDFSQAMIDQLEARAQGRRIQALRMDGQALKFPVSSFDRVCSVLGVALFPDWRTGLTEMARVLRPGGLAVVTTGSTAVGYGPYMIIGEALEALFPGTVATIGVEGITALAGAHRFAAEMHKAGFRDVEIHTRSHMFGFDAAIFETARHVFQANAVTADLDEAGQSRVLEEAARIATRTQRNGKVERLCAAYIAVARL